MRYRILGLVFVVAVELIGCATTRVASAPPPGIWQDQAFDYRRDRVAETRETLFALDPAVVEGLTSGQRLGFTHERRLDLLLSQLYGPGGVRLAYNRGHSTGAMQTWNERRGDCLSMTVLTYAAANALGLTAHMQEVRVPVIVDRHDGVEFVNGHVNVFVRNESDVAINGKSFRSGGIVIDFEPQVGARNSGDWLTQDNILARFYNNRGTEFLVQRDYGQAYAYYKAAIETDPTFVPSFSNLAQLYSVRGLLPASEQLLRHALALGGDSYAPLRTLHRLLTDQARLSEAQDVAKALAKLQDEDPYYWFGKGLVALREGRNGNAVDALERAAELTTGFEEIHYHLGLAYLRNGQRKEASRQMAALSAINTEAPGLAVLNKKMAGLNAVTSLQ